MIPEGYLNRLAQIESGNNPKAKNPKSSAKGKYQFIDSTAKAYGLEDPMDEEQSEKAVIKFTEDNYKRLNKELGREPTAGELYLAHQQGAAGALRLLKNPEQKAVDLLGQKKIELNAGTPEMTASDFAAKWTSKFDDLSGSQSTDTLMGGRGEDTLLPEGFEIIDEQAPSLPEGFEIVDEAAAPQAAESVPSAQKPTIGQRADAAWEGIKQGATLGFGDELQAGIAGLYAGLASQNLTVPEAYNQALSELRQEGSTAREQSPATYYPGMIAGTVATGLGAAKYAPQLLRNLSTSAPLTAAAVSGAVSGAVGGFGSGEGSGRERLKSAGIGGLSGAAAGPAFSYIGGKIAGRGLGERAKSLFTRKQPQPLTPQPTQSALSGIPVSQLPTPQTMAAQKGNLIRMPEGAATGDVEKMRLAEAARQGLMGKELEAQMAQVDAMTQADALNAAQGLAGGLAGNADETLMKGVNIFKARAAAEKRLNSRLMNIRNEKIASTSVYADYTKDTLIKELDDLVKTPDFKVFSATGEGKIIKDKMNYLKGLTKAGKGANVKAINFAELSAWRRSLNAAKPGTQEGVYFGQMSKAYDDWLDNITESAFKNGDRDTVDAIFKANSTYKAFKDKYGTNAYKGQSRIIENILQKSELDDSQIVNMAFGKGAEARTDTIQTVRRMMEAVPENKRPAMQEAFRSGLVQRALEKAYDNSTERLSMPILKNQLLALKKSAVYQKQLATPEHAQAMDMLIADLDKVITSQSRRDVYSPSGPMLVRAMDRTLQGLGFVTGKMGGRAATETIRKGLAAAKVAPDKANVEKQLSGLINTMRENVSSTAQSYGRVAGSVAGGATGSELVVPVFRDQNRAAMEGRGPEVDLPDMP